MLFGIQSGLLLVGTLIFLAFKAWAFVDALTHRAEAYEAAGKLTKQHIYDGSESVSSSSEDTLDLSQQPQDEQPSIF